MRTLCPIFFIILVSASCFGRSGNGEISSYHSGFEEQTMEAYLDNKTIHPLLLLLSADQEADLASFEEANSQINELSQWFRADYEVSGKENKCLKKLFTRVHDRVFKEYELYSPIENIFKSGSYNCVSGSGYFAYLLSNLGYKTSIWETPHHVYVIFYNSKGERIMIESTDAAFGFISSEKRISELEKMYSAFDGTWGIEQAQLGGVSDLFENTGLEYRNEISFVELHGLQYLNMAVTTFMSGDHKEAFLLLSKADIFYPSPRTAALLGLFDH
jgi:hypothetical protein